MKLSEAIREGAKLRPQSTGVGKGDFSFNEQRQICSCAMGAAYEAAGLTTAIDEGKPWPTETGRIYYSKTIEMWPVLAVSVNPSIPPCNICEKWGTAPLDRWITHINDNHGWTREQIADWVETIENTLGGANG